MYDGRRDFLFENEICIKFVAILVLPSGSGSWKFLSVLYGLRIFYKTYRGEVEAIISCNFIQNR